MAEPRILLLCSNRFALPSLQVLAFFKKLEVVCIPQQFEEMIEGATQILKELNIPVVVLQKKTFAKKIIQLIAKYEVNTGLMITFPYKLPRDVYELPANGFYNIHQGPLPEYRGMDPVFQQIRLREKYAGVTLHKVDGDFDTGAIVISEKIKLDTADTHGILNEKLGQVAGKMTATFLKLLEMGMQVPLKPQDESKAIYYKKHDINDVCINWQVMDAKTIIALINACNPWNKGAVTKLNGKIIRLLEAVIVDSPEAKFPPGTILSIDEKGITVATVNNKESVCVSIISMDEGFHLGKKLMKWGIQPGHTFSRI